MAVISTIRRVDPAKAAVAAMRDGGAALPAGQPRRLAASVPALAVLGMLAGCGPRDGSDLPQADAAHWMESACGIRFAGAPKVIRSTVVASRAPSGAPASVVLTVVLPDGEADAAVAALADNRTLHRRGQSETRYSYESFPDARPEKECELDRSQHVLYLRYVP